MGRSPVASPSDLLPARGIGSIPDEGLLLPVLIMGTIPEASDLPVLIIGKTPTASDLPVRGMGRTPSPLSSESDQEDLPTLIMGTTPTASDDLPVLIMGTMPSDLFPARGAGNRFLLLLAKVLSLMNERQESRSYKVSPIERPQSSDRLRRDSSVDSYSRGCCWV